MSTDNNNFQALRLMLLRLERAFGDAEVVEREAFQDRMEATLEVRVNGRYYMITVTDETREAS